MAGIPWRIIHWQPCSSVPKGITNLMVIKHIHIQSFLLTHIVYSLPMPTPCAPLHSNLQPRAVLHVLVTSAQAIGDKFERAMVLFGRCHNMYDSSGYMSESDADDLSKQPNTATFSMTQVYFFTFRNSCIYVPALLSLHLPVCYRATQNALP